LGQQGSVQYTPGIRDFFGNHSMSGQRAMKSKLEWSLHLRMKRERYQVFLLGWLINGI